MTPTPVTGEFLVNTHTDGFQHQPTVAALAGGGFVVTWESTSTAIPGGNSTDIHAQLYDAAGNPDGDEFRVNTVTSNPQAHPAVAALDDGGFVITYAAQGHPGDPNFGLYGQRFDASGAPVGVEFHIDAEPPFGTTPPFINTDNGQVLPTVVALSDDRFVVTWTAMQQDGTPLGAGIFGRIYDVSGNSTPVPVAGEFHINTTTAGPQQFSSVAALDDPDTALPDDGGFVVTWASGASVAETDIFAQRFDATGAPVGGEFQVNTETFSEQTFPSTAALAGGGYVVTWSSVDPADFDFNISGRLFDRFGAPVGGEFTVNTETDNRQVFSSVTALSDGGFVVTWQSHNQDQPGSGNFGVFGRRFDASGAPVGDEFQINQTIAGDQGLTTAGDYAIAELAPGKLVVVWSSVQTSGLTDVYARRFAVPDDGVNHAPVAVDDVVSVAEDNAIGGIALANDVDADGDALTASLVAGPAHGRLTELNTDGSFSYLPDANFNGVDSFTYRVNDGTLDSNIATVTINVTPVNDAPVADNDSYAVDDDNTLTVTALTGVLDGDTDADGDPLTAVLFTRPANGALTLNADGSFSYTPNANFNGTDSFTYRANDGTADSNVATVTINVGPVNHAPVITSDGGGATAALSHGERAPSGTSVTILNATDQDAGQTLTFSIVGGADAGLFTIFPILSLLRFVSLPNFEAPADADGDNVYEVTVQVSDGNGGLDTQDIAVTVTDQNDRPAITSDGGGIVSVGENTTAVTTVTATDDDAGQTLSFSLSSIFGGTDNHLFTIDANTGALAFAAAPDFEAPADTDRDNVYEVGVRVSDGNGGDDNQVLQVRVQDGNDEPVITSDGGGATAAVSLSEGSTRFATRVTAADQDAGQTLSFSIVGGADADLFTIDASTGTLVFAESTNFEAPADAGGDNVYNLTVQVSDGIGGLDTQDIAVTVTDRNDRPVITSEGGETLVSVFVDENTTAVTTVTATDEDAGQTLSFSIVGGEDADFFTIDANTGALGFVAAPDFEAPADALGINTYRVTVEVSDGNGGTDTQFLFVRVQDRNDAPVAVNDVVSVREDNLGFGFALTNDVDADGDTLTATLVSGPAHGVMAIAATGVFAYLPNGDFNGVDSFTYRVNDGTVDSNIATVTINVTPVNDAPVADNDVYSVTEDHFTFFPVTAGVLVGDTDEEGDALSADLVTGPAHGGLALFASGAFQYLPDPNFTGTDSFTYKANDGEKDSNVATVTINVLPVNDAPVITSNGGAATATRIVLENTTAVTTVTADDVDGDTVAFAIVGGADQSHFTINPVTGALAFATAPDFENAQDVGANHSYQVIVRASDGVLGDTQTITVNVANVTPEILIGNGGDNTFLLSSDPEAVSGGDGSDTVSYSGAAAGLLADLLFPANNTGNAAGDTYDGIENLTGSRFSDILRGDDLANVLNADDGDDTVVGRGGNDKIVGGHGGGDDVYDGGEGIDEVIYSSTTLGIVAALAAGTASGAEIGSDTLIGIENVSGGAGGDTISGDALANILDGLGGDDRIDGRGGNDMLVGGEGNDTVVFSGRRSDYTIEATGEQTYRVVDNRAGPNDGTDVVSGFELFAFSDRTLAEADLLNPPPVFNVINGTPRNDRLNGTAGADEINGLAGHDRIEARGGDDLITAGAGNDLVWAGSGDDVVMATMNDGFDLYHGDGGSDTFDLSQTSAAAEISLGVTIFGVTLNGIGYATSKEIGFDELLDFENVIGGSGNDEITGDDLANILRGGAGNDTIEGLRGNDTLAGDAGNDRLTGGRGSDLMTGGSGADRYVFQAGQSRAGEVDTITDFVVGQDHLQLQGRLSVAALAEADLNGDAVLDTSLTLSDGAVVQLLGVNGVTDWHVLL